MTTPELLTAVGIAASLIATLIAVAWRLSARLATVATKDDLMQLASVLASKADVTALGDRLDKRIDDLSKEVHILGERVAGLEGAVGYSRKAL